MKSIRLPALFVPIFSLVFVGASQNRDLGLFAEYFLRQHIVECPAPEYPEQAVKERVQGEVDLFVIFDSGGVVIETRPLNSDHKLLSEAIVKAVKEWRLKPFNEFYPESKYAGELRFIFSLKDDKPSISNAPQEEQMKFSKEFNDEIAKINKKSSG